jgi:hypothetical protein
MRAQLAFHCLDSALALGPQLLNTSAATCFFAAFPSPTVRQRRVQPCIAVQVPAVVFVRQPADVGRHVLTGSLSLHDGGDVAANRINEYSVSLVTARAGEHLIAQ